MNALFRRRHPAVARSQVLFHTLHQFGGSGMTGTKAPLKIVTTNEEKKLLAYAK